MEITHEIMDRTNKVQVELQDLVTIAWSTKKDTTTYQDCLNAAIYTKLAELELKLEKLQNEKADINPNTDDFPM